MNNDDVVYVEVIDADLLKSYGPFMQMTYHRAVLGQRYGKWSIVMPGDEKRRNAAFAHLGLVRKFQPVVKKAGNGAVKHFDIVWVQDAELGFVGGAELSGEEVLRIGQECGFDIGLITPGTFDIDVLRNAKILVLNNLFGFSDECFRALQAVIFEQKVPYVKYEHDHRELGRLEFSRRLFRNALLNVFISPKHRDNHREIIGVDGLVLPLAIDCSKYCAVQGVERKKGTALVSNVRNFKVWSTLQAYVSDHPEIEFTILGDVVIHGNNVAHEGKVPPEDMPALYSRFEYLVHLLDGWGAGERVVFEAALCGCKVICNDKVGHASWGGDFTETDNLRRWLTQAPYEFWRTIERIM